MRYHPLHHKNISRADKRLFVGDTLGWIGAVLLIVAYILLSSGVFTGQSLVYQLLNFGGAIGLIVLGLARQAYPSVATNIVWLVVAAITITGIIFSL